MEPSPARHSRLQEQQRALGSSGSRRTTVRAPTARRQSAPLLHVCLAACGVQHSGLAVTVIRSIHHSSSLHGFDAMVHLLHDGAREAKDLVEELQGYRQSRLTRMRFNATRLPIPVAGGSTIERAPCKYARLWMPSLLSFLEAVVYLDKDTYVLGNLADLTRLTTTSFNKRQWAGLVAEAETGSQRLSVDAGVWLVNITRCRHSAFPTFAREFNGSRRSSARSVLNLYFGGTRSGEVYTLSCQWSRRALAGCDDHGPLDAATGLLGGIVRDTEKPAPFISHGLSTLNRSNATAASMLNAAVGMFLVGNHIKLGRSSFTRQPLQPKSRVSKLTPPPPRSLTAPRRPSRRLPSVRPLVHVCLVACGHEYTGNAILTIRSIHLSSLWHGYDAVVHVLHDGGHHSQLLQDELASVRLAHLTRLRFDFVLVPDPREQAGNSTSTSRFIQKHRCTTARLGLAELLPALDVVVYIDIDTYVMDSLAELADQVATSFNGTQWSGLVSETEVEGEGWYGFSGAPPHYGTRGLNAGVWVLNATRCRQSGLAAFVNTEGPAIFKRSLSLGDQDVLNAYFQSRPDEVFLLDCKWNWRIGSGCSQTNAEGISSGIAHGNRRAFFDKHGSTLRAFPEEALLLLRAGVFLMAGAPRWGVPDKLRMKWFGSGLGEDVATVPLPLGDFPEGEVAPLERSR